MSRSSNRLFGTFLGSLAIGALSILALYLRYDMPLAARTRSPHDDELFFRTAESLMERAWLGPYGDLTLVKGPMLSFVALGSNWMGLPFKTVEFALYLLGAFAITLLAYRLSRSMLLAVSLYAALAFNPVFWSRPAMQFLREPLYQSLSLGVFALAGWILWHAQRKSQKGTALALGIFFGAFWLTREESVWIYPSLGLLLVYFLLRPWPEPDEGPIPFRKSRRLLGIAATSAVGFAIVVGPVAALNHQHYGRFITNEFRSAEFRMAVGALMRIDAPAASHYVPVSLRALSDGYEVSPALATLRPWLENTGWARFGASHPGVEPGEVIGGSFVWALRSAAAAAGFHVDADTAARFYAGLAAEINDACDEGRIACRPLRNSLAPPFPWDRLGDFLDSMFKAAWQIIVLDSEKIGLHWSSDPRRRLADWERILGPAAPQAPLVGDYDELMVQGWVSFPLGDSAPTFLIEGPNEPGWEIAFQEARDVIHYFRERRGIEVRALRFVLTTSCVVDACSLQVVGAEWGAEDPVTVQLAVGERTLARQNEINVEKIRRQWSDPKIAFPHLKRPIQKSSVMSGYSAVAKVVFPVLWLVAGLGLVLYATLDRRESGLNALAIVAFSALVAVGTRAALVAYIDTTSWHVIDIRNLMPAYAFGIVYSVLGTYLFFATVSRTMVWARRSNSTMV